MNWNEILKKDVGTVLRGGKAPHQAFDDKKRSWPGPRYMRKRAWLNDLLAVCSQLAAIVRCNAPMIGGLDAAKVDAPNPKLEAILSALRDDIASGLALSEAMAKRRRFFPPYCVDLVAAGERTGRLHDCLNQVSDHLLQSREHRNTIAGYLMYLGCVLSFQIFLMMWLFTFVIPRFAEIFADFGAEPPRMMLFVAQCGEFIRFKWWILLIGVCGAVVLGKLFLVVLRHDQKTRHTADALLWRTPGLGTLLAKANLAHAAAVLEKLLSGGVPIDVALRDVASGAVNPFLSEAFRRIQARVEGGETFTGALDKEPSMPASFKGFVSLGESSGLLPEALARVSQLYRRQVVKTTRILLDVVTPFGIVAIGCATFLFNGSVFATLVALVDTMIYAM